MMRGLSALFRKFGTLNSDECLRQLVKVGPDVTGVGSAERADLEDPRVRITDMIWGLHPASRMPPLPIELKQTMAPVVLLAALP